MKYLNFLLLSLIFLLPACGHKQKKQPPPPPPAPVWESFLENNVGFPFDKNIADDTLTLHLQSKTPFTSVSFDRFLIGLWGKAPEMKGSFKKIILEASGEEGSVLTASLSLRDLDFFLKKEISEPEFLRRLDVQEKETLPSIKKKLKLSRAEGRHNDAEDLLKKWAALEPQNNTPLSLLANVYRDLKRYKEAEDAYRQLLKATPSSVPTLLNLAYIQIKKGLFDDAIDTLKKAEGAEPKNLLVLEQMALAYQLNNNTELGLKSLAQIPQADEKADLLLIKGNLLRLSKKYSEAKQAYAKAKTLSPQDSRILFNLILVNLDEGNLMEAKEDFNELKGREPLLAEELDGISLLTGP